MASHDNEMASVKNEHTEHLSMTDNSPHLQSNNIQDAHPDSPHKLQEAHPQDPQDTRPESPQAAHPQDLQDTPPESPQAAHPQNLQESHQESLSQDSQDSQAYQETLPQDSQELHTEKALQHSSPDHLVQLPEGTASQEDQQSNQDHSAQPTEVENSHINDSHQSASEFQQNSDFENNSIGQLFDESHHTDHQQPDQHQNPSIEHNPAQPESSHQQTQPDHDNPINEDSHSQQSNQDKRQDSLADLHEQQHVQASSHGFNQEREPQTGDQAPIGGPQDQHNDTSYAPHITHQVETETNDSAESTKANQPLNTTSISTSDTNSSKNNQYDNNNEIPSEEASQDMRDIERLFSEPSDNQGNLSSYDFQSNQAPDFTKKRSLDQTDDIASHPDSNYKKPRSNGVVEGNHAIESQEDHTMNDLDLQFEKAIEDHHRETSQSPATFSDHHQQIHGLNHHEPQHQNIEGHNLREEQEHMLEREHQAVHDKGKSNDQQKEKKEQHEEDLKSDQQNEQGREELTLINEKEDLQMIANELEQATSSKTRQYSGDDEDEKDMNEEQGEHMQTNTSPSPPPPATTTGKATSMSKAAPTEQAKHLTDGGVDSQHSDKSQPSRTDAPVGTTSESGPEASNEYGLAPTGSHASQENTELSPNDTKKDLDNGDTIPRHSYIPANSELFKTNAAFVAYNELSSQLPPLAALSNAQLTLLPLPIAAADYLPPRIQLLINTLPTLDNLATQLLRIVALGPYQKIIDLASNPTTPAGATYRDLTSLFEFTKKLYNEEDPFLTVEHIAPGMWKEGDRTPEMFRSREQSIESTLRKVNLATFLAAILGTIEVGFFYLNESFLDVFCPANNLDPDNALSNMSNNNSNLQATNATIGETVGKLLKPQAVLYLDLKTQAYISAIEAGERSHQEILEDIFPSDLEYYLQTRRNTKILSPVESDFVARCKSRKQTLLEYPIDQNLGDEYEWFSFLSNLIEYVAKNMGFLIWGKKGKGNFKLTSATGYKAPTSNFNTINSLAESSSRAATTPKSAGSTGTSDNISSTTPHSQELLQSNKNKSDLTSEDKAPSGTQATEPNDKDPRDRQIKDLTSALLPSEILEQQIHLRINPNTTIKSLNRRPWSREEEKALRHALELKGPSWSTILGLFGAGGKISEALKNRSQVQLKDKARNWKMFFLKSGLPVPTYLQKVTGDLEREDRSRARSNRSKKTAAAPVPNPSARGGKGKVNTNVDVDAVAESTAAAVAEASSAAAFAASKKIADVAATKAHDETRAGDNSAEKAKLDGDLSASANANTK